ncbi:hypothetical protein E2C01_102089 [Portunus trituberculatus]|uniref:Uncharacterized protein n=1 Tax=Portunus trituberculatus TaxID=210409 RepID=A0A5B7KNE1_PORTR|nr:hypothetical protein [Portunus trituberculatus]
MTKVTNLVDVHLPPASLLKSMTKRHHGAAESVAPVVSVQPPVTPSVSDRASCDEDGLCMETSDDIVTAVPRRLAVSKSAVKLDLRPPMTGKSDDGSHHSPVGRKAAVQRPITSQLLVSTRRFIISSQMSHGQLLLIARLSTAPK